LGNVGIRAALDAARKARAERTAVTADYVIVRLQIEAEREGVNASHSARVQALHLLGKHQGLFGDQPPPVSVNVQVGGPLDLSKLSDDQLRQLDDLLDAAGPPEPGGTTSGQGGAGPS
jgi:hypothetical protein